VPFYRVSEFPKRRMAGPPVERFAQMIMAPETTGYPSNSVFVATIPPGGAIPDHTHPDNDEIMFCVGNGEALVDGKRFKLSPDDVIFAYRGVVHGIWNTSADTELKLFCVFVPAIVDTRFDELARMTNEYLAAGPSGT
jgi:quercetin dioxygenase-like cupin family protein